VACASKDFHLGVLDARTSTESLAAVSNPAASRFRQEPDSGIIRSPDIGRLDIQDRGRLRARHRQW